MAKGGGGEQGEKGAKRLTSIVIFYSSIQTPINQRLALFWSDNNVVPAYNDQYGEVRGEWPVLVERGCCRLREETSDGDDD